MCRAILMFYNGIVHPRIKSRRSYRPRLPPGIPLLAPTTFLTSRRPLPAVSTAFVVLRLRRASYNLAANSLSMRLVVAAYPAR